MSDVNNALVISLSNSHVIEIKSIQHYISTQKSTANHINEDYDVSNALSIASYWSAFLHLTFAILGTFVLKRFSTAFAVGCFLGCSVIISQQNLFMFAAFIKYQHGSVVGNVIFADLAFALFVLLTFFSLILGHFRHYIIVK